MRKSQSIVILFCLAFVLSIGYAVVNTVELTITGSAEASTTNVNTYFTGDTTNSTTGSATTKTSVTSGSKTASLTISNMTLNETVTIKYKIANEEQDIGSKVTVDSITNSNSTYFQVSAKIDGLQVLCPSSANYGEYNYLVLTVKMIKTPITSADSSANIGVTINATPDANHSCPV